MNIKVDTKCYGTTNLFIRNHEVKNIVKALRMHKGWTQAKLAKKMGVSQAYIARLERSNKQPGLMFQYKLAQVVGAEFTLPRFGFMK